MCRSHKIIAREKIEVEGEGFSSLKDVAVKYSVSENYLRNRMRHGQSISEILQRLRSKEISINGKKYRSIKEAADEYKLPFSLMHRRMKMGMSAEEAVQLEQKRGATDPNKRKVKEFRDWKEFNAFENRTKKWDEDYNSVADYAKRLSDVPVQKAWSDEDETLFAQMVNDGLSIDYMALKLNCHDDDITQKLQERGDFEDSRLLIGNICK